MELAAINMSRNEARKAFLAYREVLRKKHSDEDAAIMKGYRVLSEGKQIISLPQVLAGAGVDQKGLPKLAIARADLVRITVEMKPDGAVIFGSDLSSWSRKTADRVKLPSGTFDRFSGSSRQARAIVPNVPAHLRPPYDLRNYHILWEADWKEVPKDPALLKSLGGGLYAVLAVWDLTELERAVLGITRTNLPR